MTRLLAALALVAALGFSFLAVRQPHTGVLREEDDSPSSQGYHRTYRLGRYVRGRGFVVEDNRSGWSGFRGGGPGFGK